VWKEGRANAVPATAGTRPVGSFASGASPWGLLDMAGNVREWCADRYGPYAEGRAAGPETGEKRVLRGGSFVDAEQVLIRGARRHQQPPTFRSSPDGFRGARGIE
jgi:formylglycine-generating enzyme required for sulfatase activity